MIAIYPLHLIPLLPFIGALFALMFGKRVGKDAVTLVCCGSVFAAAILTVKAICFLHHELPPGGALVDEFFSSPWIAAADLTITAGLLLDHLSAVMALIVTGIGFLIHLYASSYMEDDAGYTRFFGYLNLFMGAMLILVLGDSAPVTFVGWEGVGLCSYLLIGFWHEKEANVAAGKKAFIVNRIGDFGFLLALFLLFTVAGTLKYSDLGGVTSALSTPLWFGLPAAYFIGLLVLVGAAGKSAQIPLYVWLPDAMAGPTPVSALIHAATMVTAGIYVIARMHVVFEVAPVTLAAVAVIGALTALFAATIAITQRDLKKVLAYSTISQLGFMFAGVGSYLQGTSNYQAGIFHLLTHAFFKAGLFLGAGSVMHGLHNEGDIFKMGGLKKYLPHTRLTFLIYCLAIAGIFPLSGFWSKDAILTGAHAAIWPASPHAGAAELWFAGHLGHLLYAMLSLAAACTAFYMFRLYFLVFEGVYRGHHHPHESPARMTFVLWALAAGSLVIGFLGIPDVLIPSADHFGEWLSPVLVAQASNESRREFFHIALISSLLSIGPIGLAWWLYGRGPSTTSDRLAKLLAPLHRLVYRKYYIDELYDFLFVKPFQLLSWAFWKIVDVFLIDLLVVNGPAYVLGGLGTMIRFLQNGDAQRYVTMIIFGTVGILWAATFWSVRDASHFRAKIQDRTVSIASTASGPVPKRLRYRIDWEDRKSFGAVQDSLASSHHYDSPGKKKVVVEVIDPRWQTTSRRTQTVVVK